MFPGASLGLAYNNGFQPGHRFQHQHETAWNLPQAVFLILFERAEKLASGRPVGRAGESAQPYGPTWSFAIWRRDPAGVCLLLRVSFELKNALSAELNRALTE